MTLQEKHEAVCAKAHAQGHEPADLRLHVRASFMAGSTITSGYVAWWAFPGMGRPASFPVLMGIATTMDAAIERAFELIMESP